MRSHVYFKEIAAIISLTAIVIFSSPSSAQQSATSTQNFADCYWQDALNGAFCEHTFSVRIGAAGDALDWSSETYQFIPGFGSLTKHESYRASWIDVVGGADLTPYPWLKLSIDADFDRLREEDSYFYTSTGIAKKPFPGDKVTHAAYWGGRTAEANLKLLDTGPGDVRYFAHVFAEVGIVPGQDDVGLQSCFGAGAEAGARWALGPMLALNARTLVSVDHFSASGATAVFPSARALLSFDPAGLAFGPVYDGAVWTAMSGAMDGRGETSFLGGEGLIQPFRVSDNAVLNGIIVDGKVEHTVGPATFETGSRSSGTNYTGTVSFNFHY